MMDKIHMLGRQLLAAWVAFIFGFLAYKGIDITDQLIIALSGPAVIYTAMKGKGKTNA